MRQMKGISASPGLASGPVFVVAVAVAHTERRAAGSVAQEWLRLEEATEKVTARLAAMQARAASRVGVSEAEIFEAQAMMLADPELLANARRRLESRAGVTAEEAWQAAVDEFAEQVEALPDEYLSARAADLRDVGLRVLRHLQGVRDEAFATLLAPSIILARDLSPADTVELAPGMALAFCTAEGGPTSHTAILAKAMGIPAVVGLGGSLLGIPPGSEALVDGGGGLITIAPDETTRQAFTALRRQHSVQTDEERRQANQPAITVDGHAVEVVANIGRVDEAGPAIQLGAEGVGLLRTEFLFLDRSDAPTEDEQAGAYRSILEQMGSRPVVVRTLDVGGDKPLTYLPMDPEANPFLGWRAIRLCLDRPDFFKIQLRALWRASPAGNLRIMFPMIATLDEVRRARALLEEARGEVAAHNPAPGPVQVGIMVEIPSVVVMAEAFAQVVDFFSIGTNDLTQYTFAAERTNPHVAYLADPCHPAILRQVRQVIDAGHRAGIWVGVCGELAGDADAIPVLLGLGLDEFSMAPASIPHAKAVLRTWGVDAAREVARAALQLDSAEAVRGYVRAHPPGQ
ncbi:MAG TPA: phosphoenolpyruvate--protein phosphotransferase [Anaerolineaceae bacterium]|jgi:phosphoenolpyruvate-protein phosphotransferase